MEPLAEARTPIDVNDIMEDVELVKSVLAGSPRAFDTLAERIACVPGIVAARNARAGSPLGAHELDDVVQESFLVVWRRLPEFRGHAALKTWIYRICTLQWMNALRARRRPTAVSDDAVLNGLGQEEEREEYDELYAGLDLLDPAEADVLRLKHFDGRTFEEIGRRMDCSPNTAKTRYYRAILRLQEFLEGREGER